MKLHAVLSPLKKLAYVATLLPLLIGCSDHELLTESGTLVTSTSLNTATSGTLVEDDCLSCTYIVPLNNNIIDGAALGLKPGDVIGLSSNIIYPNLIFRNIVGSSDNPIVIKSCGGLVQIDATGKPDGIKTINSKYFRITGGDADNVYGIKVIGGHMGINLGGLSTNFEVDHVEITNSGFAGIMAKTDPGCNEATWRANFLMADVRLHHNLITNTGGEGIYAGNSFFTGMNTPCGVQLPHEIHDIKIYANVLKNTGWDAIQLGCATEGASIYGNTIENYGVLNEPAQNNGIQIGSGTGGLCHSNLIRSGTGNGLIVMGLGDNIVYNNIIDGAGSHGIFCDERYTPGPGFKFINNTIINPKADGIRIYAEKVPMNVIINNIIANPGSYAAYVYPRSPTDAFIYKLNNDVKIELSNNYFTTVTDSLQMIDAAQLNYRLEVTSPVIDQGTDLTSYCSVYSDFYNKPRLRGARYDIGAVENATLTAPNSIPVAYAGGDVTLTEPANSLTLTGRATDSDGTIISQAWTQYGGLPVTITDAKSATANVSGLVEGRYYFKFTVMDDEGAVDEDNMLVTVLAAPNTAPVANAGPDVSLDLGTGNSVKLNGSGTDSDGWIASYSWTQYGGPVAAVKDANTSSPTIDVNASGNYYFRLTVTDNDGATAYDNMLISVTGEIATVNEPPTANAGPDKTIRMPLNTVTLYGTGTDTDGTIQSYTWTQYGGPAAIITNANSATASLSGLAPGKYYFRLTVRDDDGATDYDNVLVKVLEAVKQQY